MELISVCYSDDLIFELSRLILFSVSILLSFHKNQDTVSNDFPNYFLRPSLLDKNVRKSRKAGIKVAPHCVYDVSLSQQGTAPNR